MSAFLASPPVDFANAFLFPLPENGQTSGIVSPGATGVVAYTLDASAGDRLGLSYTRLSGNLNLGVAVVSADNKIVFQASLVTSETLSTVFTLPTAGEYTIGVFRIELLPPDEPAATEFQIQVTLNP
ncbi:MAG: PPC domain-containing protein [Anaerolineae bacterium]|nr:PPC domain-containing protein [Anaerolineae bacterium]